LGHSTSGTMIKDNVAVHVLIGAIRGAGDSKGHTSWQSKAEQNDYISFMAFMIYYVHNLTIPQESRPSSSSSNYNLSPVPSHQLPPAHQPIATSSTPSTIDRFIIGGYSYGALIATFLPGSIVDIVKPFQSPQECTAYAEIRLRAAHLAAEQSQILHAQYDSLLAQARQSQRGRSTQLSDGSLQSPKSRQMSGVRVGGEEDIRRASHDSLRPRTSFNLHETPERVRKSIDRVRSIAREKGRHASTSSRHGNGSPTKNMKKESSSVNDSSDSVHTITKPTTSEKKSIQPIPNLLTTLKPAYILISPPVNHFTGLASLWSSSSKARTAEIHDKLTRNPTFALFGDSDSFLGVKRFRAWAEKIEEDAGELFMYREVQGAGHFWNRREDVKVLRDEVAAWAKNL
jgi:alpha/beta superfamily hydrolase